MTKYDSISTSSPLGVISYSTAAPGMAFTANAVVSTTSIPMVNVPSSAAFYTMDIKYPNEGFFDPLIDLVNKVVECSYCDTTYILPEVGRVCCPGCGANAREKAVARV